MAKEFLNSRAITIPDTVRLEREPVAIAQLRSEVQRLRAAQPVETPVPHHDLGNFPVVRRPSNAQMG